MARRSGLPLSFCSAETGGFQNHQPWERSQVTLCGDTGARVGPRARGTLTAEAAREHLPGITPSAR